MSLYTLIPEALASIFIAVVIAYIFYALAISIDLRTH